MVSVSVPIGKFADHGHDSRLFIARRLHSTLRASSLGVHADVAQLAEAQALGACQCGFESRRRHKPHELVSGALVR